MFRCSSPGVNSLLYLYFPGRTGVYNDTHARLRAKFVRLAEFLDAPSSNGSLVVGWMDCLWNAIPPPHGLHVHADTIVLYPANSKTEPAFWTDLRGGDVDIHELVDFVFSASALEATKVHVRSRANQVGERGLREGITKGLLTFDESLDIDERKLVPLNLTRVKDEL